MKRFFYGVYNYLQYPVILAITFLVIRYSQGYSTHPGVHIAISTVLIDVITLRIARRWNIINLGCVLILNAFGALAILRGGDPFELKVSGWYDLCALMVALTNFNFKPQSRHSGQPDHE